MKLSLLNLGCGLRFHPEWTNVDIFSKDPQVIQHDLRKKLPFADNTYDMVYHSHVLEHFKKREGRILTEECWRVLKPGGILRICVPDLERIAREYISQFDKASAGDARAEMNREWMSLELFDQMVRNRSGGEMGSYLLKKDLPNENFIYQRVGEEARNFRHTYLNTQSKPASRKSMKQRVIHLIRKAFKKILPPKTTEALQIGTFRLSGEIHQWMYDKLSLSSLLKETGFEQIEIKSAATSGLNNFSQYELDAKKDGVVFKPDSLFIEAIKKI